MGSADTLWAKEEEMPRVIIILYQYEGEEETYKSFLCRILETPLNHLGLIVEYHNINDGIPNIDKRQDIRGIVTWYDQSKPVKNPRDYVHWLTRQVKTGRKLVIMEETGFSYDYNDWDTQQEDVAALYKELGLRPTGTWIDQSYNIEISYKNPYMVEYERKLEKLLPTFEWTEWPKAVGGGVKPYLLATNGEKEFALIVSNPNGGYVSLNYTLYRNEVNADKTYRAFYLNPFEFFREALDIMDVPTPDTTTFFGNRIYYSHIDGDGWNNLTQLEEYRNKDTLCSEVIYERIFLEYPNLPVTVGPIGADLDPKWAGLPQSGEIASKIFQLPHIETASHTYSHPFSWGFFKDGNIYKEIPYFPYYPRGYTWAKRNPKASWIARLYAAMLDLLPKGEIKVAPERIKIDDSYDVPRAFAQFPFNINQEIKGSYSLINQYAPPSKPVQILLWSGDTQAFSKAMELVHELGIQNLNGGDNQFDWESYSVSWIAPKGRKVGPYWQIYASSANETIYTRVWEDRFYAYRYLVETLMKTESPLRLLPLNIYYHLYIGEKKASLDALIQNIKFALTQDIFPVSASHYAKVVQGFYTTKLVKLNSDKWQVSDRGELQTIRFDKALLKGVDFQSSKGVIGQRHFQGSLYVILDKSEKFPIIRLKKLDSFGEEPEDEKLYVIQSNWKLEGFTLAPDQTSFTAYGYGDGKLHFKAPKEGSYKVQVKRENQVLHQQSIHTDDSKRLSISLPLDGLEPVQVTLSKEETGHA